VDKKVINGLLRPKTVAVIGASATPGKIGYTVVDNLVKGKYEGKIYPINPTATEILGLKVYPTITDVPGSIDSAIVTVPAKFILEVTEECGKKGVRQVSLEVRASNFDAQRFYQRLGFFTVRRVPKYYSDGEDGMLFLRYL